jgi:hypothetical protein
MTSSFRLKKRYEQGVWDLGPWNDTYIVPNGACWPGHLTTYIGNAGGVKVCRRVWHENTEAPDLTEFNGYHKFSADLYRPWSKSQAQMYNPDYYHDRRTKDERWLIEHDYLHLPINYDGIGMNPVHTPPGASKIGDQPKKFLEYGYDSTPSAPLKYDVTRLRQAYPVWKDEQEFIGISHKDTNHRRREV